MVFLLSFKLALLALLAPLSLMAEDTSIAPEKSNKTQQIQQEVEVLDTEILDLEVSYEIGTEDFIIIDQANSIENQLLYHEYQLGTPSGGDQQWNESEQMILDAKIKLEALQNKMKLEGDWGKVRLRVQDFGGEDPGAVKLRYNYGF